MGKFNLTSDDQYVEDNQVKNIEPNQLQLGLLCLGIMLVVFCLFVLVVYCYFRRRRRRIAREVEEEAMNTQEKEEHLLKTRKERVEREILSITLKEYKANEQERGNANEINDTFIQERTSSTSNMVNLRERNINYETIIETECSICFQAFSKGQEISVSHNPNCHHYFHKDCILDWLARNGRCPSCRRHYLNEEEGEKGKTEIDSLGEGIIRSRDGNDEVSDEENQTMAQVQSSTTSNQYDHSEQESMRGDEYTTERAVESMDSELNYVNIQFPVTISTTE